MDKFFLWESPSRIGVLQFHSNVHSQSESNFNICRQSGVGLQKRTLYCKQGSFQSSAILQSVLPRPRPFWSANTYPISAICHRRVATSDFYLLQFHQILNCPCTWHDLQKWLSRRWNECSKFKKSHSELQRCNRFNEGNKANCRLRGKQQKINSQKCDQTCLKTQTHSF